MSERTISVLYATNREERGTIMLNRLSGIDRNMSAMEMFRRRMEHLFQEEQRGAQQAYTADEPEALAHEGWPWLRFFDAGVSLVLKADLPGMTEKDVRLTVQQEVLSLTGERKPDAPEGYFVHRQERTPLKFARSFALPCRVDSEKSTAVLENGVMTITLPKTPEAQPRQISIKVQ
jgi:HSP20 family protein